MESVKLRRKILLVDDHDEIRDLVADRMSSEGWTVVEANSGRSALIQLAQDPSIDLVVSDLQMSQGDGFWLLRHIEKSGMAIPVLVMTGDLRIQPEDERLKAAKRLFYKPFLPDEDDLIETIRSHLDH